MKENNNEKNKNKRKGKQKRYEIREHISFQIN